MICPRCGYDMENKNMCLRCGYRVTDLAPVQNKSEDDSEKNSKQEEVETKVIDPCNVYLTHPYGVEDDDYMSMGFGGGFGSIFDMLFGDPFDIIGDIFGMGSRSRSRRTTARQPEEPPKKKRKQGPIVDVAPSEVEVIEDTEQKHSSSEQTKKPNGEKKKNSFRHNRKKK